MKKNFVPSWIALFRLPNLFTIPGDIMAGFFLAAAGPAIASAPGMGTLFVLIAISLALYSSGLILNDWFDLERDRRERPWRPLPSGSIAPSHAFVAGIALTTAALCLATFASHGALLTAISLTGLSFFYNAAARRLPVLGFITMGLCRGANIILGASWSLPRLSPAVIIATSLETCYVIAITAAAHREVERKHEKKIGWLIHGLIPLQAALLLLGSGTHWLAAGSVLALWPLARLTSRRFPAS